MTELYTKYFSKSYTFLYPLLGLDSKQVCKPLATYLAIDDTISIVDRKLTLIYEFVDTPEWQRFKDVYIKSHYQYDDMFDITIKGEDRIAVVFDFTTFAEDFDTFLAGQYSKFTPLSKKTIMQYYSSSPTLHEYLESFLYPQKYYSIYSSLLDVPTSALEEVVELCNRPDFDKETLKTQT